MKNPLGAPAGTVRAILTMMLVLGSIATLFVHVVDDRAMGMLLALTVVAVQSYFSQRKETEQYQRENPPLPGPVVDGEQ